MSSNTSSKNLSGPEKVALAVKKLKHAQARKIVNESIDKSLGSLRKKRKLSSLQQSFVMKQALSLKRQNRQIIDEIVKLKKYVTMVENSNHDLIQQQGKLLMKIVHLREKLKSSSAENTSLKRLLVKYQQKYKLGDEEIDNSVNHKTIAPERILSNKSNEDVSSDSSDSEMSLLEKKSRSPATLQCGEVCPDETLPSYIYISMHEDQVDGSESNRNKRSLCSDQVGDLSPLSAASNPTKNDTSSSPHLTNLVQINKDTLTVPRAHHHTVMQEHCSDSNSDDDCKNLSLRLPGSAESSFMSSTSGELEAHNESNPAELTYTSSNEKPVSERRKTRSYCVNDIPDDISVVSATKKRLSQTSANENSVSERRKTRSSYANVKHDDISVVLTTETSSSGTVNSECIPKRKRSKRDRSSNVTVSELSENVHADSVCTAAASCSNELTDNSAAVSARNKRHSVVFGKASKCDLLSCEPISESPENVQTDFVSAIASNSNAGERTTKKKSSVIVNSEGTQKTNVSIQDRSGNDLNTESPENTLSDTVCRPTRAMKNSCINSTQERNIGESASEMSYSIAKNSKRRPMKMKSVRDNRLENETRSESSKNAPTDSLVSLATECDITSNQKQRLKPMDSNVTKKKARTRKRKTPCDKEKDFDFFNASKDSFIIDDNKRIRLPRSQSLSANSGFDHGKSGNEENEAPRRRPSRTRQTVSYVEPRLGSKLRRGDKFTDGSLYVSLSPKKTMCKKAQ